MADVNNEVRSGEQPDQKPKFKTNKVNVMFRQTTAETEPTRDHDSASPGPAVAAKPTPKSSLALSHGRFTLAAIREPSTSASSSPSPAPQAWQRGSDGAATTFSATASSGSQPVPQGGPSPEPVSVKTASSSQSRSVELNEEELTAKGISLAGRFHSASDMHWEDEEDDWMPPQNPSSDTVKQGSAPKPEPADAAPAAPALKPAEPPSDTSPWSSNIKRTAPPAARPLTETIKEMKEQKGHQRRPPVPMPMARMPARPVFAAPNVRPGDDALSRFRINRGDAGVPHMGRGPPPLNPRDLTSGDAGHHHHHEVAHSGFDAAPDEADFSMFAKRKPLATPHDPPKPHVVTNASSAAPVGSPPKPTSIPERFRLKPEPSSSPEPSNSTPVAAPVTPTTASTATVPTPEPGSGAPTTAAASSATTGPEKVAQPEATPGQAPGPTSEPQQPVKSALELQKEEMRAILAAAKAKREAEEKAEREKQERLAHKREEMRREIEEKRAREREEKERAHKERQARLEERAQQLKAQREKERQERLERQQQARSQRERERQQELEQEQEKEQEQEREREREREIELAHPVHTAGDWAAAKKKAGGPIFQQAWNPRPNGSATKSFETRNRDEVREPRVKDSRESWDTRKSTRDRSTSQTKDTTFSEDQITGVQTKDETEINEPETEDGVEAIYPQKETSRSSRTQLKDARSTNFQTSTKNSNSQITGTPTGPAQSPSQRRLPPQDGQMLSTKGTLRNGNGLSARYNGTRHDLPVARTPLTRHQTASFADEQFATHLRRPVRVKLPKAETAGGFDVNEMMLLDTPQVPPEFISTDVTENASGKQFREPLIDRRLANVRMPGDKTPKPRALRPFKGAVRSKQYSGKRQHQHQHHHHHHHQHQYQHQHQHQQPQDRQQEHQSTSTPDQNSQLQPQPQQ